MKTLFFLPVALAALTGCNPNRTENTAPEGEKVALFKEGKGVLFSSETKNLFGVEIVDVAERPMQRRFEKRAQVYLTGGDGAAARALLLLDPDEARLLTVGESIGLKSSNGSEIGGKLICLDAQTQRMTGQIEALIEFPDPQQRFLAGAFITATFARGEVKPVVVVPESALLAAADGIYVYTVNGTHLLRTRVKAGQSSGGLVAIEEGLYLGDEIAAKGIDSLWLVELSALKGGTPCCPVPKKKP